MSRSDSDVRKVACLPENAHELGRSIQTHIASALEHIEATSVANAGTLRDCRARIGEAMDGMGAMGTRLRVVEARLCFETARLRRSGLRVRAAQEDLQRAQAVLSQKADRARGLAVSAERTARLIAAIDAAMARGEPVETLLAEGDRILAEARARTVGS